MFQGGLKDEMMKIHRNTIESLKLTPYFYCFVCQNSEDKVDLWDDTHRLHDPLNLPPKPSSSNCNNKALVVLTCHACSKNGLSAHMKFEEEINDYASWAMRARFEQIKNWPYRFAFGIANTSVTTMTILANSHVFETSKRPACG
ncbi:hypothetical protein N7504_003412 [Penicillium tannophilum]|nr:hypothetical protein N7504_003412 [Penicillium tannophilum]